MRQSHWRYKIARVAALLLFVVLWQLGNERELTGMLSIFTATSERSTKPKGDLSNHPQPYSCSFRSYPRYYGIGSEEYPKSFLRKTTYIRGIPPILLPTIVPDTLGPMYTGKVCFQPSPDHLVETVKSKSTQQTRTMKLERPYMDGTNPTIISVERILEGVTDDAQRHHWTQLLRQHPTAAYVVSSSYKSAHQCDYNGVDSPPEPDEIPVRKIAPGRQSRNEVDVLLVDKGLRTLHQTTIVTKMPTNSSTTKESFPGDDARLFVDRGAIWLTFKRYGDQGGNGSALYAAKIVIAVSGNRADTSSWTMFVASEWAICCGRNFMALPSHTSGTATLVENRISFLTWPDPVWVQELDISTPGSYGFESPTGPRSPFHGTSAFLLYLEDTQEYLGIGHRHRDRLWAEGDRMDAKFGHHYTHSFFTITSLPPYRLTRISQEFVFPSKAPNITNDADIIQFASGIEWVPGSKQTQIILAYGINDCEGATVVVDFATISSMLTAVPAGEEVSQQMAKPLPDAFKKR